MPMIERQTTRGEINEIGTDLLGISSLLQGYAESYPIYARQGDYAAFQVLAREIDRYGNRLMDIADEMEGDLTYMEEWRPRPISKLSKVCGWDDEELSPAEEDSVND